MKQKTVIQIIIVVVIIFLLRQIFWSRSYEFIHETDNWENTTIEIIRVDGSIDSTHYSTTPYKEAYREDKITVLAVIHDKQQFISNFENLISYQPLGDPVTGLVGDMIRCTYPDGSIELISSYGAALVSDSEVLIRMKTFDSEAFNQFLSDWVSRISSSQ